MPSFFDHVLVLLLAVAWPLYATFVEMPRVKRRLAAGDRGALARGYRVTIAQQWVLAGLVLLVWTRAARPLGTLGLRWPSGWGLWVCAALALAFAALLWRQLVAVREREKVREAVRPQLAPIAFFLPRRPAELRTFLAMALTAGFCEELLFRGYLTWYLGRYVGLVGAVALTTVVFALAHAYQGRAGVVKAGLGGLAMSALWLPSRSLLVPMLVHATTDVFGGLTTYEALRERPSAEHEDPSRRADSGLLEGEQVGARR